MVNDGKNNKLELNIKCKFPLLLQSGTLTQTFDDINNILTAQWKLINVKSITEKFIYSGKFTMPLFPKIFWRIKFYPVVKKNNSTAAGLVLCADGNLFANYDFDFDQVWGGNKPQSGLYFCSDDSESAMSTFDCRNTSVAGVLITCTIRIPHDAYIGGESLRPFQYCSKVLSSQKCCDFVIKVQNKSFNVHKCILSTHWPYFVTLLGSGMFEANSGTLTIEDQEPGVIEAMIYYIYTGTSNVTDLNLALELITVSDKYNLPDLKQKSLVFVIAKMNKYCVIKALLKAKLHGLNNLFEACIDCLKKDGTVIIDLPNYDLLGMHEDGFELLTLCLDNVRGIKRKLE